MIEIPQRLVDAGSRFIMVRNWGKEAIEKGWAIVSNYSENDPRLLEHIGPKHGNYGVLSHNGICMMDIDKPDKFKASGIKIPASFTVTRGETKRGHYYFTCSDCPKEYRIKHELTFGDVRLGGNFFVVGPGSTHPSGDKYRIHTDLPLADLPFTTILDIIYNHGIVRESALVVSTKSYSPGGSWGDLLGMRCEDISPPDHAVPYANGVRGSNPFHGSENGNNFEIDTMKNVWICRRHSSGGGALVLYSVKKGIIQCEDAGKGCLRGHGADLIAALKNDGYDLVKAGIENPIFQQREETRKILEGLGVL